MTYPMRLSALGHPFRRGLLATNNFQGGRRREAAIWRATPRAMTFSTRLTGNGCVSPLRYKTGT